MNYKSIFKFRNKEFKIGKFFITFYLFQKDRYSIGLVLDIQKGFYTLFSIDLIILYIEFEYEDSKPLN